MLVEDSAAFTVAGSIVMRYATKHRVEQRERIGINGWVMHSMERAAMPRRSSVLKYEKAFQKRTSKQEEVPAVRGRPICRVLIEREELIP
jgi:hypothetical protein